MSTARPALAELGERLEANGVFTDPERVATAILGLAHLNGWTERPDHLAEWLTQLAVDLAAPERLPGRVPTEARRPK